MGGDVVAYRVFMLAVLGRRCPAGRYFSGCAVRLGFLEAPASIVAAHDQKLAVQIDIAPLQAGQLAGSHARMDGT